MSKETNTPAVSPFALKIGNEFSSRADDVFGGLGNIEAKHEAFQKAKAKSHKGKRDADLMKDDPIDDSPLAGTSRGSSGQRGWSSRHTQSSSSPSWSGNRSGRYYGSGSQRSEFKRPSGQPPPRRGGSSRKLDPSKWTYYNLSSVSQDDLSDRSNTAAALSFLQSRRNDGENPRKKFRTGDQSADDMEVDSGTSEPTSATTGSSSRKHVFKRSSESQQATKSKDSGTRRQQVQIAGRPGCVVMPEYVVGQNTSKKSRHHHKKSQQEDTDRTTHGHSRQRKSTNAASEISLSHLQDEDEEDGDSDIDEPIADGFSSRSSRTSAKRAMTSIKPRTTHGEDDGDSDENNDDDNDLEMMDTDSKPNSASAFPFNLSRSKNIHPPSEKPSFRSITKSDKDEDVDSGTEVIDNDFDLDGLD